MSDTIYDRLKLKEREAADLTKLIILHADKKLSISQKQEADNLQMRLEFRLLDLEEKAWDSKIEVKKELLRFLQAIK